MIETFKRNKYFWNIGTENLNFGKIKFKVRVLENYFEN